MKLNTKSLAQVEIGIPVIAAGVYHGRIDKVEVKPNKKGDGNNLILMFRVLDPVLLTHKDGKEIVNRGQIVSTRYFSLVPTDNYDPDQNMKMLAVAIKHPATEDLNVEDLDKKLVMLKLDVREARKDDSTGKEYPESNEVSRITPIPEADTFVPPPF